ncbi:sodium-dependent transporter [Thiococcus pfennigii]|jgi:NSS family neurotransmitter:Na+ symporter|uniref:sodium-dependent transporter n=1 Tax=Thiococcus pfennigii TaxID=1057 RepID=UPI0019081D20|nr:sodium-dependent transporter [Thiococcus pfennigii]MBK1731834.1 sodium-dependent transporter [Thiococcus pfennigii]
MAATTSIHGMWSSRLAFILAATGSAVGLGNIWRFPYTAGEYGGGAFVLVYLICVAAIGIPIMMAEIMLGRRGRQSPINTMLALARQEGRTEAWQLLGWLGIVCGFLILSFYSVIAGWTMAYVVRAAAGVFHGADAAAIAAAFDGFVADPERLLAWHTIFMVMVVLVVARGVASGLERAVRFLMPALFVLLVALVGYAMTTDHFAAGLSFLFRPDFSKLSGEGILSAMGQAFFSLSLGMGAIMIYGSYLNSQASIARNTVIIAGLDTLVALLAGLAIFPIVFAQGLAPEQGTGLVFKVLPIAFGQMPGGQLFGTVFFLLLVFAAWTSAISLLEPMVAWLVENLSLGRVRASVLAGMTVWLLGVACLLSLNVWSEITVFGLGFLALFDFLTANILLPLGGLLIAVFAGWVLSRAASVDEFAMGEGLGYRLWRLLIRFVAPIAVAIVFLHAIQVF